MMQARNSSIWGQWSSPSLVMLMAVAWLLLSFVAARAEPRIALVIGNGSYGQIEPLDNPGSDSRLIARTLSQVGFDVTLLVDGDQTSMKRVVADFGRSLRAAGPDAVGLFYYAGHGVQVDGINYLLPVDSVVHDRADLDLVGVEADWVLRQLFSARNRTNIVILDACRNNPFPTLSGIREGLAEMNAPPGTFIAYASAPGAVALDGVQGTSSPFTGALAAGILQKGEPIEQVFRQVRVSVVEQTAGMQTPWDSSSLTSEFFFAPPDPVDPREAAAEQLWESVKASRDSVQILYFLKQYPDTRVSAEARALLMLLVSDEIGQTAPAAPVASAPAVVAPEPLAARPSPRQPSEQEAELIGRAQASQAVEDYEAYLEAYPSGTFAALAQAEVRAFRLEEQAPAAPPEAPPDPGATSSGQGAMPESAATVGLTPGPITFRSPLMSGPPINGRSIAEVILGSPQYPPVEGLPENYWKSKTCSNCHQWTQSALCEQGKTYMTQAGAFALDKHHPLDGFKQVLRDWASSGCG